MTREQCIKLCGLYNSSDMEAFIYLKDFVSGEQKDLLERLIYLNQETDIGDRENYKKIATGEEEKEYFVGKEALLRSFGIDFVYGDAMYEGKYYAGVFCRNDSEEKPDLSNTDRYFYILEDVDGERFIHIEGNLYPREEDDKYEFAEWSGCYVPIAEAKKMLSEGTFFNYIDELVDYCGDVSKPDAEDICSTYFNGASGTYLEVRDIDEDTPLGDYFFDRKC